MFEFSQISAKGLRIVITTPSLEASNVAEFKAGFGTECPTDLEGVTIEMSEVEMIDSSGIGALLSVHKRLAEGNQVVLRNVQATYSA